MVLYPNHQVVEGLSRQLPLLVHRAVAALQQVAVPVEVDKTMEKTVKIGTRGSQLALWQANWVKGEIERISGAHTEIIKIKTTGDQITDRPLSMVGGKGLFVKEIEQQLLDREIDIAVHSMKDMPGELPEGLTVGAVPLRENPFDVLISRDNIALNALPAGSRIGTSSLRRASQIKHARPDLIPISIRGNLDTRLRKLESGEYDAILLAAAGLIRLGMAERITQYLDEKLMVPAVGQGALCIESRQNDPVISQMLAKLDHKISRIPVEAERSFLKKLEGSCHIPVACFGRIAESAQVPGRVELILTGLVASEDGTKVIRETITSPLEMAKTSLAAEKIGMELAEMLLMKGAKQILENLKN